MTSIISTSIKVSLSLEKIITQIETQTSVIDEEWLEEIRQEAKKAVLQSQLPSKKDEDWRFTDLTQFKKYQYEIAAEATLKTEQISPFLLPESKLDQIVFVNGVYQPQLSQNLSPGVYVGNLTGLSHPQKERIVKYLRADSQENEVFSWLNKAGMQDLAIIWVEPNIEVKTVIQLLFISCGNQTPSFTQPQTLIIGEKSSKIQFVETYTSLGEDKTYWTNSLTQIFLEENAQIHHTRIQQEAKTSFYLGKTAVKQERDSKYTIVEISLGGRLSRHNLHITQQGEQTETRLYGLSVTKDEQIADTHSKVALSCPYGTVEQLHKCILDDRSQAIFNGKVLVPKAAQMTNAAQLNRNLLLSTGAQVNTKPELQITADNVKCSHGATVSQLEEDEIFYLRSRGLTQAQSRHLLVDAFAAEIIDLIPYSSLRQSILDYIK